MAPRRLLLSSFTSLIHVSLSLFPLLAEAPPSGMSKNGYFFQEMGESDPPLGHLNAAGNTFFNFRKDPLHFVIQKPPIIHHCPGLWSSRTEETLHVEINNELFSACDDNAGFITVKPRRGSQLVCAAQASRTQQASIGSSRLPQPVIPSSNTPIPSADPQKALAAPPCLLHHLFAP